MNNDCRRPASLGLIAALLVLAALALLYFSWPVYRAFLPLQIDSQDAWNTFHDDLLRAGHALYEPDLFVSNNYPPLSYYLVTVLSAATAVDVLYIGRALSLAAAVATSLAIWACIRQLGASRLAATLGAVWWLASMARWFSIWVGSNDPSLVALAATTAALALALRNPKSIGAVLAVAIMAVAGFYKHNLVAIPAATLCWLIVQDRPRGLRAALIGIGLVVLGLVICGAIFGAVFFHDMLQPRLYHLWNLGSIGRTQGIAPALIIAGIWAAYRPHGHAARFVMLLATIAFVLFVVQSLADGVSDNAMFELTVAAAIGIGCAFDDLNALPIVQRWGLERSRIGVVCILIARLLLSERTTPYLLLASSDFRAGLNERVAVTKMEIMRIAAIPGPVVCNVAVACHLAGKPPVYDDFMAGQAVAIGIVSASEAADHVRALNLRFEAVDVRASVEDLR